MIRVCVLGATGSIGESTLSVLARHPDRYEVAALTANTNIERLFLLCEQFKPAVAVVGSADMAKALEQRLRAVSIYTDVLVGVEGLTSVASAVDVDVVMAAIVGAAGLEPTLAAVKAGKKVLLANKESLVMSGHLFMDAVREYGAQLLPIDSEQNAIFQCLPDADIHNGALSASIRQVLLTASGGPFLKTPVEELSLVTPDQACAHPNWQMGRKISVDSATMMNKGLEVIETCWLFDLPAELVQVVIHPQSVIHSMVEYHDGSVLGQLGSPDMRIPIAHALAWPERIESGAQRLSLFDVARLDFKPPDFDFFPCLKLAYDAFERGGTAPAILNASNEVAVASFLEGQIKFTQIADGVGAALNALDVHSADNLEAVLSADKLARQYTEKWVAEKR